MYKLSQTAYINFCTKIEKPNSVTKQKQLIMNKTRFFEFRTRLFDEYT